MRLPNSVKIQIHVGGVYGDKNKAKRDFSNNFNKLLEKNLQRRLVIENVFTFGVENYELIWMHRHSDIVFYNEIPNFL